MNKSLQVLILISGVGLAMLIGFAGGIIVDRTVLVPAANVFASGDSTSTTPAAELDLELVEEAYQTIQQHFADRETLVDTNLTYSAISGMVDSLGDTGHSRFLTPEMVEKEAQEIQGEFEGIGALLNVNEQGNPVILAPFDNSPAQRAGLKPGDIIMAVNGEDVSQSPLSDVVSKVVGPAGTDVTLTIMDPDSGETRDVTITRARIVLQNVTWQMLPGTNIAHVRIASYSNNIARDLRDALNAARDQGAQSVILDLRNNPGGLLNEAVDVVGHFIERGNALQIRDADGNIESIPAGRGRAMTDLPMVVLINQGSASASEITAGALQDYGRATLVGETTFGTGTVLNQFQLSDGSAVLLATQMWLTPNGRVIWHEGIQPDEEVVLPADVQPSIPETERDWTVEDLRSTPDTQLKRAIELLSGQLP